MISIKNQYNIILWNGPLDHLISLPVTFWWGYLKNRVYTTPPQNREELQDRIRREVDVLRNNPDVIRKAVHDMIRRCGLCLARGGGHVESVHA